MVTSNRYITVKDGKFSQKISKIRIEKGEHVEGIGWTNFEVLSFCDPKYSYGHPAISPDGKYLYFVSKMRGGIGGSDIYRVEIMEGNLFGKPENLGLNVNSKKKEVFPFISKDNSLYFSSNRPNGKGQMDIYKCEMQEDGTFGKAQLLEDPINTRFNDYSFMINDDLKSGYFSSNRSNGKGGDDLCFFHIKE